MEAGRTSEIWARTTLRLWPEHYVLASLEPGLLGRAAALAGRAKGTFVALLLERDEVSLVVSEELWNGGALEAGCRAVARPFRVLTLDCDVDLEVTGYFAPAAERLARAGIPIVPACGYLKDHILVREQDAGRALAVLEELIAESRA